MKTIAQQDDLPLKPAKVKPNPERIYRHRDSRFWQARYRNEHGRLICRTTGCTLESSARTWLALTQREVARRLVSTPPPPAISSQRDAASPSIFPA